MSQPLRQINLRMNLSMVGPFSFSEKYFPENADDRGCKSAGNLLAANRNSRNNVPNHHERKTEGPSNKMGLGQGPTMGRTKQDWIQIRCVGEVGTKRQESWHANR